MVLILVSLGACQESSQQDKADRYPWQITLMEDGSSRVFDVQLGVTTAGAAMQKLGTTPSLALFENPDGQLSLELFYREFTRAGLSGKLILSLGEEVSRLQVLKQRASKLEKLESGVTQYRLESMQQHAIDKLPVVAMTYIPYANLTEEIILARFGEPAEKIRSHEQAQHWLYPDRGLDLIINEAGKEVLQYVSPKEFGKLARPLHR
jgi:hypothetical protein